MKLSLLGANLRLSSLVPRTKARELENETGRQVFGEKRKMEPETGLFVFCLFLYVTPDYMPMCSTIADNFIHLPKIVNCDMPGIYVYILTSLQRALIAESLNLHFLINSDNNNDF